MRAGFGEMPQLFAVPTLGLPTLNNHRHNLTLIVESMGYCPKPPSVQAHGKNLSPCAVPFADFASTTSSMSPYPLRYATNFDFSFSHILWLQPEVFRCDDPSGQLRCKFLVWQQYIPGGKAASAVIFGWDVCCP